MREILRKISLWGVALVATSTLLYSCESDFEENEEQREKIVSFLESSHVPKLIAESDLSSSLENEPQFYSQYGSYAYRYIADYYNPERKTQAEVTDGSQVTITFRLYPFTGTAIAYEDTPTYTNDPYYNDIYIENGLDLTYWNFEPIKFTIGSGDVMDTIQEGLKGCRKGDSVEIYMTNNMGYEDAVIGVMEQDISLAFFCTIDSVEN